VQGKKDASTPAASCAPASARTALPEPAELEPALDEAAPDVEDPPDGAPLPDVGKDDDSSVPDEDDGVPIDDDAPVAASPRPASTVLLQRSPRHTPSAHSRPLPHSESAAQRLLQALTPMTSSQAGDTPKMQANNNPRGYQ
jgi:hypothetical protein